MPTGGNDEKDHNEDAPPLQAPDDDDGRPKQEQEGKGGVVDQAAYEDGPSGNPPTPGTKNVVSPPARNYEDIDGPLKPPYRPPSEPAPASSTPAGPPVSLQLPREGASIATSTITGTGIEASTYSSPPLPVPEDVGTSAGAPQFHAQLVPEDIEAEIAERVQKGIREALERVGVDAVAIDPHAVNQPQILGLSRNTFYLMLAIMLVVLVVVAVGVGVGVTNAPSAAMPSPILTEFPSAAPSVCSSWVLVAYASARDNKMFAYNNDLRAEYAYGTFVEDPVQDTTTDFQRIFPFTSPDYIKFETVNLAHSAIYVWSELRAVIDVRGAEFEANIKYLYSNDGAKSYESKWGNVLSRVVDQEDPWIDLNNAHCSAQMGAECSGVIWGENGYYSDKHANLTKSNGGVIVYISNPNCPPILTVL